MFGACDVLGESFFPDADLPNGNTQTTITWRGDPKKTHSDWTIVVAISEFDTRTYHVHKMIMTSGPYSSKYFTKIIEKETKNDHSQPTRIELDEQDANSFPFFLDFVYNNAKVDVPDEATLSLVIGDDFAVDNAVSLRHLARIFECSRLTRAVNKFIQKDLSAKTGPAYLSQAYVYRDESLIESAKRQCIENFLKVELRSMIKLSLPIFRSIVKSVIPRSKYLSDDRTEETEETVELSYHLSDAVCQYFEKHPKALSVKLLLELTDENIMPMIAPEPAIGFTAIARELDVKGVPPNSEEWKLLVLLCRRCAGAVVREYGWSDFNVMSALDEYLHGPCSQQQETRMDSLLFATSFAAALSEAQHDSKSTKKVSKQPHDLEEENSQLRSTNKAMRKELSTSNRALEDAKDEILSLKRQLKGQRRK